MHSLLRRQVRKATPAPETVPSPVEWAQFLEAIDRTYTQADQDRYTLERSVEISSREMQQLYANLRRASESDLAREHDRMQAIFASIGDGLSVLGPDGTVQEINPEGSHLIGLESEEIVGRPLAELVSIRSAADSHQIPLTGTALRDADAIVSRPDGVSFPVRLSLSPIVHGGATIGAVLMFRDVTERKQAEDQFRESSERYRSLVRNAPYGICHVRADGQLLAVNPALVAMLGYDSEEELLAVDVDTLYQEWLASGEIARQYEKSGRIDSVELGWKRKDRTPITVRVGGRAVFSGADQIEGFELIVEDITDRLTFERALRQSQKMEAVGQLAGGIAHDFNNLLTAILGYANMALERVPDTEPLHHDVKEIVAAGERAAGLTRQLLAYSRRQLLRPAILDVNDVVAGMEAMMRRLIGEHVRLTTSLSGEVKPVEADRGQLEQVIMNLAVNARDAMPQGGNLTIETDVAFLDEAYARARGVAIQPGPYTMVAVSDTGCGMDAATQARIFEPFFTTKRAGEGTGLGLATVYGIVKQSNGYVWLYSEPGRGTTFKVYLPVVNREVPAALEELPAVARSDGSETILVVEDEDGVRQLMSAVLRRQGYTVLTAPDGVRALEIALPRLSTIDLLVTDVVMPGMAGPELAAILTREAPDLKVLFTSGYADAAIVNHGLLDPGVRFLQKPFTPSALSRTVHNALSETEQPDAATLTSA